MNPIKDAKKAEEILFGDSDTSFNKYALLYCNSNENLTNMMSDLIKEGDTVLTVAASGDQYLTSTLLGAKQTDIFDINQLTYYFTYLKIASLMVLDLEEYRLFLEPGPNLLNKNIYQKVRNYLDKETRMFFDYILPTESRYLFPPDMRNLFHSNFLMWEEREKPQYIPFLQEDNYKKLQSILLNKNLPKFYRSDVYSLIDKLTCEYDVIMLSNISSYQDTDDWSNFILNVVPEKLTPNGIVQCDYSYADYENTWCFKNKGVKLIKTGKGQSYRCYKKKF